MALNVQKFHVAEKQYLESVRKTLTELPQDGSMVLMMLCEKTRSFSDSDDYAPVFTYHAGDRDANCIILGWADYILQKKYMLPSLTMHYLVATMNNEEFSRLLTQPDEEFTDQDLLVAVHKYRCGSATKSDC